MPNPNEKSMLKVKAMRLQPGDILDVTLPNGIESYKFKQMEDALKELQSEHPTGFMFFLHEEDATLQNIPVQEIIKMYEQAVKRSSENAANSSREN